MKRIKDLSLNKEQFQWTSPVQILKPHPEKEKRENLFQDRKMIKMPWNNRPFLIDFPGKIISGDPPSLFPVHGKCVHKTNSITPCAPQTHFSLFMRRACTLFIGDNTRQSGAPFFCSWEVHTGTECFYSRAEVLTVSAFQCISIVYFRISLTEGEMEWKVNGF